MFRNRVPQGIGNRGGNGNGKTIDPEDLTSDKNTPDDKLYRYITNGIPDSCLFAIGRASP